MEREIPRGVPWVLPLVWHRDHVSVVEMGPLAVAAVLPAGRRRRLPRIALEPMLHDVVVVLLRPQEPRERLPRDAPAVVGKRRRDHRVVEVVGLALPLVED